MMWMGSSQMLKILGHCRCRIDESDWLSLMEMRLVLERAHLSFRQDFLFVLQVRIVCGVQGPLIVVLS